MPNGSSVTIPFSNISTSDASWCTQGITFPIPSSVPVSGAYCEIGVQLIEALASIGVAIEIEEANPIEDCYKGPNSIPGYFISLPDGYSILSIAFVNCSSGAPIGNGEFKSNCQ